MAFHFLRKDVDMGDQLRDILRPDFVEDLAGQFIELCWWLLPKDGRNPVALEHEVRRVVDVALKIYKKKIGVEDE